MNDDSKQTWGVAGLGVCGGVSAEVDEPIDGGSPWHLDLSGKGWHFVLNVAGMEVAFALSEFVTAHVGRAVFAEHRIDLADGGAFIAVKDGEFEDRWFLRLTSSGGLVWVTLQDEAAVEFQKALEDLVRDLRE